MKASVIGPMCAVNRITSEPPCHPQCARYAVQACPFLSQPRARRNEKDLPEERREAAGIALDRNPGVTVIWASLHPSKPFQAEQVRKAPSSNWARRTRCRGGARAGRRPGKSAWTRSRAGLPALVEVALPDGREAMADLAEAVRKAVALLPADAAVPG